MFQTYQTKLKNEIIVLPNEQKELIFEYYNHFATQFGILERKLFVDLYVHKKPSNDLKTLYCAKYAITSRQYNSIKNQLDGRVKAKKETDKSNKEKTVEKIERTENLIEKKSKQKEKTHASLLKMKGNESNFQKKVTKYRRLRQYIHQKKRKLHHLKLKLEKLQCDEMTKTVRLCFGSKELFRKQFHLEENNLTFEEWKKQWQQKRSAQFTFIGSKDETYGNQTCTYDLDNNVRIRVSPKDEAKYGKNIVIPNVCFSYGQEQLDKAKFPVIGYTKGKGTATKYYRALTCKFIRKNNHWYLIMSIEVDLPEIQTIKGNGVVSVDFNAQHLAVTDVDRFGNLLHSFIVPFRTYHVSSEQAKQSLSDALEVVVKYALQKQKPIVREELDFKKKKSQLKEMSNKHAKMLSGFAYSSYKKMLDAKCEKSGIEIISVNPSYTSQIGHHKYMKRYGLSSHESAAMVIGRKALNFKNKEKVPMNHIIDGNQDSLLGKNRMEQWKALIKQWKRFNFNQKNYLLYNMN